ncbi:subtilisin-like protease SBT3.18 isoform X2 [Cornus florida]|nr:subtilisin-like protease SBT3.18 isoform X2 [Cornus florida]XP_059628742.1 subtilisin-like protease SBT3.18 isoform X2 [Cornus florida]
MLYSYKHSFSGFSAKLNSTQAITLATFEGVISVFKSKTLQLHTTRSWDFMGLTLDNSGVTPLQLAHGDDIIVGVIDTGVSPESVSFQDGPAGLRPIPSSWKGKCVPGENFDPATACNRKLIGARYYLKGFEEQYGPLINTSDIPEYRSPRDSNGHGTHTASTAVGSIVSNASFFALGQGIARGGAPRARLAVYKVCWNGGICSEADIMAAFDDALSDGVHVISVSLGQKPPMDPFFEKAQDIGSFHAMQKGVTVVFSAGNSGPGPSLVENVTPWSLCVAASSIDRTFPTEILLDNKISITGQSFNVKQIKSRLVDAGNFFINGICKPRNWNQSTSASGRYIILCFSTIGFVNVGEAETAAWFANASGLIFAGPLTTQDAYVSIIPVVQVDMNQGTKLGQYLTEYIRTNHRYPSVQISASSTAINKSPAPIVAPFSSRGPSTLSPEILKPDISAPGVNILAAWPQQTPPTGIIPDDTRTVNWTFLSGTSMSCPHVSGAVALLKSVHPHWSPAAIKSALMTTAYTRDTTHDSILAGGTMEIADPFDIGAGHINPSKAMDPGLVYDMTTIDYILFLCNIGYTEDQIKKMVIASSGTDTSCPKAYKTSSNVNYPSITVSNLRTTTTIRRTVRNVGSKGTAIYFASVTKPNGVEVVIWPRILIFTYFKEEITYYVTLKPEKISEGRYDFGEIVWSDGFHYVRSPLVVSVNITEDGTSDYIAHASV